MALISIRNLTKTYRMGDSLVRALDGVDLDIERGEFVAIIGPSGSGKSTMMHLLGCLDRPTSGRYLLDGQDVSDMSDRQLADIRNRLIGFVFQTFNLINRTSAQDNVGVPLFYARKVNTAGPARRALERVGLMHRSTHRPNELSGGERQRVAIARAIVNEPLLLLADEPTGNLDSKTGEQIMEVFRSLNAQGVTVIIVTHEPDVAMQARRVVAMRDGKILYDRPSADLRDGGPVATKDKSAGRSLYPLPDEQNPAEPAGAASPVVAAQAHAPEPPRTPRGVTAALVCGVLGPLLTIQAVVLSKLMPTGINPARQTIPPSVWALWLGSCAALLLAFVVGVLALVWGRRILRQIKSEPGCWLGAPQARLAMVLGGLGMIAPVLVPLSRLVFR